MTALANSVEKHHKFIILSLMSLIVFFLAACTFHDVLPICHYLFGCDHGFHSTV
ncbi:MAG: hypothetical protein OEL78_05830 [Hyphomicrobiales bacterium]|nr:hypothetical protein [Hyphomicrobiales bacterium]